MSSVIQVVFSRFLSPHVNIRLDSRPVSAGVVLPGQNLSDGALLLATGNKVSCERGSEGSWNRKKVRFILNTFLRLFPSQITKIPLIGPGCDQLTTCTSCLLSSRVTECGWCDGRCTRADQCPSSVWTQEYCAPVITKVTDLSSEKLKKKPKKP